MGSVLSFYHGFWGLKLGWSCGTEGSWQTGLPVPIDQTLEQQGVSVKKKGGPSEPSPDPTAHHLPVIWTPGS